MFINHGMNSKSFLRLEQNIWVQTQLELFISSLSVFHVTVFKSFVRCVKNICVNVVGIIHLSSHLSLCKEPQIFASKWLLYLNRCFVRIIHLFYLPRLCSQVQIFTSSWAKYFNRILVWNIHWFCVHQTCTQLHIIPDNLAID